MAFVKVLLSNISRERATWLLQTKPSIAVAGARVAATDATKGAASRTLPGSVATIRAVTLNASTQSVTVAVRDIAVLDSIVDAGASGAG